MAKNTGFTFVELIIILLTIGVLVLYVWQGVELWSDAGRRQQVIDAKENN